uniref:Cytochrome b n=1 Tax=Microcosmus sulcatus TaxID=341086 RepID=D2YVG3_9ASCI|nr:cytochrome b [Microcosmus sulcatus]CAL23086.2 cytochrome b [Microcosmus sulcatus]
MLRKNVLMSLVLNSFSYLPAPANISYWWNWGSMIGVTLVLQILTGLFLTMHYVSSAECAFDSVVHIHRDVMGGWAMRSMHGNGASLFMFCIYMHIGRGIYYKSFMNVHVWGVGVVLFILAMITAFLGYVLPWGQMSFWGATVITNFLSVIPVYGTDVVNWIWGGFSVGGPTLTRFYTLHYLMPFVIVVFSLLHLVFLHSKGSGNPLGVSSKSLKFNFWPYSLVKDYNSFLTILVFYLLVVFFFPNVFGDPENFMKANSLVTPVHIKPEWYFLFAYAILRCIPNKSMGVVALVMSVVVLLFLPMLNMVNKNFYVKGNSLMRKMVFWVFSFNFLVLTWLGGSPVEEPYIFLAQVSSVLYFFSIMMLGIL